MQTMYNDVAKRETFVDNFSLPNHTSELITGIEARTSTFAELLAELRYQLARRTDLHGIDARRRAHLSQ